MPAKALSVATLALLTVLLVPTPTLAVDGAAVTAPAVGDAACAAQEGAPLVWTTCTRQGDFRASNLTLTGRALVNGPLVATQAKVVSADVGSLKAGHALVEGPLAAASAQIADGITAKKLTLLGTADVADLQLRVAKNPVCQEGKIALVRNASGADVLQACLLSASGSLSWVPLATG